MLSSSRSTPFLALCRVAGRQKDALAGNAVLEQRHETGEYNADHDLQQVDQPPVLPLDYELRCNQNAVYDQGQVGEIPPCPLADGVRHRYNGRCPQPGFGVQGNAQCQQDHPNQIDPEAGSMLRFHSKTLLALCACKTVKSYFCGTGLMLVIHLFRIVISTLLSCKVFIIIMHHAGNKARPGGP